MSCSKVFEVVEFDKSKYFAKLCDLRKMCDIHIDRNHDLTINFYQYEKPLKQEEIKETNEWKKLFSD